MIDQVLPCYGAASRSENSPVKGALSDLLPSIAARLGVAGAIDVLGVAPADHYLVFVVDGLGSLLLNEHLRSLLFADGIERQLTAGVPSTTSVSLTSIGTGLVPGQHGVAGFSYRLGTAPVTPLAWSHTADPATSQPKPTMFEQLDACGVSTARCFSPQHRFSALTSLGLRGQDFTPIRENAERTKQIRDIARTCTQHQLTYAYDRSVDHAAHRYGLASFEWAQARSSVARFIQDLAEALPSDCVLIVTGDHGGLDVPETTRLVLDDDPALCRDVDLIAGEARFRHLYTGHPEQVAQRYQHCLGERAWVLTRHEAIAAGWFGTLDPALVDHWGDVVVAARDTWAFFTRTQPGEFSLVGMHGSLTPAEMLVPLGTLRGRR